MQAIFLILFFIPKTFSMFSIGPCPRVITNPLNQTDFLPGYFKYSFPEFNALNYLGTWHDVLRNTDFKYAYGNCTQAYLFVRPDGKVGFTNSEVVLGKNHSASGEIFVDESVPGQCYAKFSNWAPWGDYKVIYTDYTRTALVFSCASVGLAHWKWAWILARNPQERVPEVYYQTIEAYGIPLEIMMQTNTRDCGLF